MHSVIVTEKTIRSTITKKALTTVALLALVQQQGLAEDDEKSHHRSSKSNYNNEEGFAGPSSSVKQLEDNDRVKKPAIRWNSADVFLQPWFNRKRRWNNDYGLQLSLAYTATFQKASSSPTSKDSGATGVFRVIGKWEAFNDNNGNKGSLVVSVDDRSQYGDLSAASVGSEVGHIGQSALIFSDADTVLVDFNWQQYLNNGDTGLLIGRYDPSDYVNVLGYANPWTTFQNLNVLLDSSIAYPDVGVGVGIGHWFNDRWYAIAGFNDANGKLDELKIYDNGAEFFKYAEIGWSPSRQERYLTNVHLSAWHVDDRKDDNLDSAHGLTFGANYTLNETWMAFVKLGWSDADAPNDPQIYDRSVTIGGMYYFSRRSDLLGVAVNYGELAIDELGSQTTTELFYQFQLAQNIEITPSIQFLKDPALNDDKDNVEIFGVRIRLTL